MAPSSSKMYIAKLLNMILETVTKTDDSEKNIEVQVSKFILDWALEEKKQFLINKLRLHYANVLYMREEFRKSRT